MGSYLSCTLSTAAGVKNSSAITVIFPSGETRRFHEPVKAAELMFEMPNFFVVNSQSLHVGRRFSALTADEELEMANLYVMFPMKKVNSVVSVADMGVLFLAANSTAKPQLSLEVVEELATPVLKHRMSMCRSRKPLLETIAEEREPIFSR